MSLRKLTPVFLFILLIYSSVSGQYPSCFSYNIENGAPSNEIYCIMQDKEGYIWIGGDAGVYRFNGVSFEHFSSPELTSRSATGLIQSQTTGRIYGYNFNNQIFYIEQGVMHVIKDWNTNMNSLTCDQSGNVWVSTYIGAFKIDEKTFKYNAVETSLHQRGDVGAIFTDNIRSDSQGNVYYHNVSRLIRWSGNRVDGFDLSGSSDNLPVIVTESIGDPWCFGIVDGKAFRKNGKEWSQVRSAQLNKLIFGRKVNNAIETADGNIWICTHSGIIRYEKMSGKCELLYPQLSFSDCLVDREGNYWFTTLHNGLFRAPELGIRTWNIETGALTTEQCSHIVTDGTHVFFAGSNGYLGKIELNELSLSIHNHEPESDFGTLYADPLDGAVYLNKMNCTYRFNKADFTTVNSDGRPIKNFMRFGNEIFTLSSQGCFVSRSFDEALTLEKTVVYDWCRDICKSPFEANSVFVGANKGVYVLKRKNGKWKRSAFLLKDKQIISVCADEKSKRIYLFSFEGIIYEIGADQKPKKKYSIGNEIRAVQMELHDNKLFLATNNGIHLFDLSTDRHTVLDRYDGLSSNNVRGITFTEHDCWIATGRGVQQIPLKLFNVSNTPGHIIYRGIIVKGEQIKGKGPFILDYDNAITLMADGINYRSNGTFQLAYRIAGHNENWITVPGSSGAIKIPSLPSGWLSIELKLIDHNGLDSDNTVILSLYVTPPFWQRWWFYVLITLATLAAAFGIFRMRLRAIKKKQILEVKRLTLENELRLTQQNALKAQMNPHFLFNVLNSIKGYIYENDKKNAAKYLSEFSSLVRKVLELSSVPTVSLDEELEALNLYIDLEAMLLQSDFEYELKVEDNVDTSGIHVPALLLQPYVENSFKHGLRHKHGPKKLKITIRFDEKKELLTVELTDNGIGREASASINATNRGEHQSFATSAMEKRIRLLNHEREDVVGVEISDNFEGETPTGTTVTIRIHV